MVNSILRLKSELYGEGHVADPAGVSLSDPSIAVLSPLLPPTIFYPPSHAAPEAHYHHSVVEVLVAIVEHP
jgi:hypothetical protein